MGETCLMHVMPFEICKCGEEKEIWHPTGRESCTQKVHVPAILSSLGQHETSE